MIKRSSIYSLFFVITVTPIYSQNQTIVCSELIDEWKRKKIELNQIVEKLQNGQILSKNNLQKIIYPEYVAFDVSYGRLETNLIRFFYSLNIEKHKRISIGPFQMQLKFMHTILFAIPNSVISDSNLIAIKKGGYPSMIENLSYLGEIKTQWKILLLFEQYCINNQLMKSKSDLNGMINLYNSGDIKDNNIIFTKIKCDRKTYGYWANFIENL